MVGTARRPKDFQCKTLTLSDSPYRHASSGSTSQEGDFVAVTTSRSLLPFAQLGLRLLGVLLIADGLGAMFGGLIQGMIQARAYAEAGYDVLIDPHSAGWAAGGIPHLIIGVYLTVGGNWILHNVFVATRGSSRDEFTDSTMERGEPSNARETSS